MPGSFSSTSGACVEQLDGLEQQVIEVERVGRPQARLVLTREPRDDPLAVRGGVLASVLEASISFFARLIAPRIAAGRNSPFAGRSSSLRIRFISCCWSSLS